MFTEDLPSLDYWLHAAVSAGVLVCQGLLLFRSDAPSFHLPEYTSMIAVTSVILLLLLNIGQAVRTSQDKKEGDVSKIVRNGLTAAALSAELAALALDREGLASLSSLVLPVIILSSLGLMRVLDSLLDAHEDIKEAVSVQCVKDPFNMRVIMIHVLMLLSLGAQILKRIQWGDETDLLADGTTPKTISDSVDSLDISALVLLSVHLGIYPLNALIKLIKADQMLINLSYCCKREEQDFLVANCKDEDGSTSRGGRDVELVALTRIPLVRHVIAGVILSANAYVLGAAYNKNEITYQLPAMLLYLVSDALGRNYL